MIDQLSKPVKISLVIMIILIGYGLAHLSKNDREDAPTKYLAAKLPINIAGPDYLAEMYHIKGDRDCMVLITVVRGYAQSQLECK